MGLLSTFDAVCLIYFITHIPITCVIDSQAMFPSEYYPEWALDLTKFYISEFNDPFMSKLPAWFQSFVACELFFQLPMFFIAVYGYWNRCNWLREPLMIYGTHVTTTMVPICYELWKNTDLSVNAKLILACFYGPYLVIPLLITIRMFCNAVPFPHVNAKKIV
eukprot:CFRG4334T1